MGNRVGVEILHWMYEAQCKIQRRALVNTSWLASQEGLCLAKSVDQDDLITVPTDV
jgi:hypothetical protein